MNVDSSQIDLMWIMLSTVAVLFMQAGFCCIETGSVRSKNSINVSAKNFCDFCISSALFLVIGFHLIYGNSSTPYYFFSGVDASPYLLAFFLFQLVFCGTASTIMSGAVAERTTFLGYLVIAGFIAGFVYPLFASWVWGGHISGELGLLERIGFVDFAGASVVHSIGGWSSLAAVCIIGPRIGRFGNIKARIEGHNVPLATVGTIILWVGWFGFNGGSTLAFNDAIPQIFLNTNISACFGAIAPLIFTWRKNEKPFVPHVLNGALTGLVAITACCNVVNLHHAVLIGFISGCLYLISVKILELNKIDDVVNAVPVHGVGGAWGTLCVALFGDPTLIANDLGFYQQLGVQALGILVCFCWAFGATYLFLLAVKRVIPLRVTAESELQGLNASEHNATTEVVELLTSMVAQEKTGNFAERVYEEPHTEVGQIAKEYNRVLHAANQEMKNRQAANQQLTESLEKLKELQSDLVEAEKMASLGELVAGIAHEINTPLGIGVTASSFLQSEVNDLEELYKKRKLKESDVEAFLAAAEQGTAIISLNLQRVANLVKTFKKVSVINSVDAHEKFELKEYIQHVIYELRMNHDTGNHSFTFSGDEVSIYTDPNVIKQIFHSFYMNSLLHGFISSQSGEVSITVKCLDKDVELTYEDNGAGISSEDLVKVFNPFFTTKRGQGGGGLGLHIVYNLVTQVLMGTIKCESSPGRGTSFTILFPRYL
ncbi:ammonium transporter [Vibrio lamellibrachiae]|uniref:ammonium transporter n=1 Tax=Vibrio lamellibrachiae TaxID=2910253 RepID=UPI003D10F7EB